MPTNTDVPSFFAGDKVDVYRPKTKGSRNSQRIEARIENNENFNESGTYDVRFKDGTVQKNIRAMCIQSRTKRSSPVSHGLFVDKMVVYSVLRVLNVISFSMFQILITFVSRYQMV